MKRRRALAVMSAVAPAFAQGDRYPTRPLAALAALRGLRAASKVDLEALRG